MSLETEAGDWFARMRGPQAEDHRMDFDAWYSVPAHAQAYERHIRAWDITMFLANTETGKGRNLDRARAIPLARRRQGLVASAALVLVLVAAAFVQIMTAANQVSEPVRTEVAALDQPPRSIRLSDGSTAVLDRGARLQISFSAERRGLRLLAGRGRFAVAHNDRRPFVVEAKTANVVAHGTLFDVQFLPAGIGVSLLEGAVEVSSHSVIADGRKRIELAAGDRVEVTGGSIGRLSRLDPLDGKWTADMLALDGVNVVDAIAAFNCTSAAQVVLEGVPSRPLKVTGAFRRSDARGFAHHLAATFGLTVKVRADGSFALLQPSQQETAK